ETGWALSDRVLIFRPEARGVRRQAFINQEQISVDSAEFKFCICDNDAALLSMIATARINFQTKRFHALGQFFTKNLGAPIHIDILVMACFCFCRRRKEWLG